MFYEHKYFLCPSKKRSEILKRFFSIPYHYIFRQKLNIFDSNLADQFSVNMEIAMQSTSLRFCENDDLL